MIYRHYLMHLLYIQRRTQKAFLAQSSFEVSEQVSQHLIHLIPKRGQEAGARSETNPWIKAEGDGVGMSGREGMQTWEGRHSKFGSP